MGSMCSKTEKVGSITGAKRYPVQYPATAYTFPTEAIIHEVRLDHEYIHVALTDGRILSIPLYWIPTVHHAPADEREKFEINRSRTMIIWDPDKCGINDEIRIVDYL
jgi:hypothetical protein